MKRSALGWATLAGIFGMVTGCAGGHAPGPTPTKSASTPQSISSRQAS